MRLQSLAVSRSRGLGRKQLLLSILYLRRVTRNIKFTHDAVIGHTESISPFATLANFHSVRTISFQIDVFSEVPIEPSPGPHAVALTILHPHADPTSLIRYGQRGHYDQLASGRGDSGCLSETAARSGSALSDESGWDTVPLKDVL